ncbi:MAG TPA: type I methionyl aminopeptidase [Luteibaculaceae bacterium]|nr:type I methionyl aminopeptidase [Luteibaculaceae bacterium]
MIILKTKEEIELMRLSAQVVSKTLGVVAGLIRPGITPKELDRRAEECIRDLGAVPAFKGYNGYPFTLCTSVNEQVVHGMPTDRPLQSGDIISVDCGAILNDFYGDHAYTFCVGEVDPQVRQLVEVTKESLYLGIEQMRDGNRTGDIGYAIQAYTEGYGYGVVRELVGHGLGRRLHEKPEVPNYGKKGKGVLLKEGLVLAVEPMINMGTRNVRQLSDGWTIVTGDGKPSAHFEHDIAIVNGQPEILSTFKFVEEALGIPVTV